MTLSQDPPKVSSASKAKATPSTGPLIQTKKHLPVNSLEIDQLIKAKVPLANHTSFRVGGPAEWYAAPRTVEELQASLAWATAKELTVTTLGAGSNLLVSDRGLPGLVISTRHLRQTYFDPSTGRMTASAGEPIPRLAWQAAERGWQGLEWAVGIPGTLGGAVVMNAGAHGDDTAGLLVEVQVISPDGTLEILTKDELKYRYRTSVLQGDKRIVTQATLQLQPGGNPETVMAATSAHLEQRRSAQPYHLPSCGSVFRNPEPYAAGWLIEQVGLKGYQIGAAQIAQRHANFILNCGGATASDIFNLIRYAQQQVEDRWSLHLEPEVKILGEFQIA